MPASRRDEAVVLGRIIGSCERERVNDEGGWDFEVFRPAPGIDLPITGLLTANFSTGNFECWGENGQLASSKDVVEVLN